MLVLPRESVCMMRWWGEMGQRTFVTPKFSIAGILCPILPRDTMQQFSAESLFHHINVRLKRTSKVELAVLEGI